MWLYFKELIEYRYKWSPHQQMDLADLYKNKAFWWLLLYINQWCFEQLHLYCMRSNIAFHLLTYIVQNCKFSKAKHWRQNIQNSQLYYNFITIFYFFFLQNFLLNQQSLKNQMLMMKCFEINLWLNTIIQIDCHMHLEALDIRFCYNTFLKKYIY